MARSAQSGFVALLAEMPAAESGSYSVLSWSLRFNAYDYWGSGPEILHDLVLPLKQHYELSGEMLPGAGFDAIRALMFYKAREHHFTDYPEVELLDIFKAARRYVADRAQGNDD